jgi:folate-dependent phosphoribosylglycinamide formyltransferase PurN
LYWLVLLKFPDNIIAYTNKVINIHPALLPKYGGKGMYGMNVQYCEKIKKRNWNYDSLCK